VDSFSLTLVQNNDLLISDPGARGVLTLTDSSIDGSTSRNLLMPIATKTAGAFCWWTVSPATGNYYAIAPGPALVVESTLGVASTKVVRYYPLLK
jgi:hypothetical protein